MQKLRAHMQLMRLDKPIGTSLLYIPCSWSILMANSEHTVKMLALFGVGAVVMRGAGCTINDMYDKEFDRKVQRTQTRPLASGALTMKEAWISLSLQLSAGLAVLTQLNQSAIMLGAASLPLVATYPLAKRYTKYPQLVLGLAFNWGALLGWQAVAPMDWSVTLPLYTAGVSWTLIYDTIYAHQDKSDDQKIGVKSTALTFGSNTKIICHGLNVLMTSCLAFSGFNNSQSLIYYSGVLASSLYTSRIIYQVDLDDRKSCGDAFVKSQYSGWLISASILGDLI